MRIKGRLAGISAERLLLALELAVTITVPLRVYQLFAITDTGRTGFYDVRNWSVCTLYAMLLLFLLGLAALALLSDSITASRPVIRKDRLMGAAALVMAAGAGYETAVGVRLLLGSLSDPIPPAGADRLQALFSGGRLVMAFRLVFGLLALVYMLLFGFSYLGGKADFCRYRLFALTPLFWSMLRLIFRFMSRISFVQVADLLFELGMLAFQMLFFLSFARISSSLAGRGEMRRLVMCGLPAALLAWLIGITRFIAVVSGNGELLPADLGFSLADPAFGFFAVAYIHMQLKYGRPASEDEYLTDGGKPGGPRT